MSKTRVAPAFEAVVQQCFRNLSHAIEDVTVEKLQRIPRTRLATECAKLDPTEEKVLAEEGVSGNCPAY